MEEDKEEKQLSFAEMGLDERLLSAITQLRWEEPTPIQAVAIPYFLTGKDILAQARTGSGKTGAFLVPLVQRILDGKATSLKQATRGMIIAPSKELCKQTCDVLKNLIAPVKREIRFVDLSPKDSENSQKTLLLEKPDIVIGTPTKLQSHINDKSLDLEDLQFLIIDEADLISAYEHLDDTLQILKHLPTSYQTFLTSATLGEEVYKLKRLVLNKPKILKLEEPPLPSSTQLQQYVIKLEELDKVVLLQSLFLLNHIRGKTLIFVKSVDRGYRLKLYFDQFGIKTCVLNSEMPVASRCNIVDQFNQGLYSTIIAADEQALDRTSGSNEISKRKKDKEAGVARGIDFTFVSNIVNFDFPNCVDDYIHRVGRTARGTNMGTALSLVSRKEQRILRKVEETLQEVMGTNERVLNDFKYDLKQLDGFKYRAKDAWRRCTRIAVKDYRKREIKKELLNSNKLQRYFEERPRDLEVLRHDINTKILKPMAHLKDVPMYNIPERLRPMSERKKKKVVDEVQPVNTKSRRERKKNRTQKKRVDPLRTLKVGGITK